MIFLGLLFVWLSGLYLGWYLADRYHSKDWDLTPYSENPSKFRQWSTGTIVTAADLNDRTRDYYREKY